MSSAKGLEAIERSIIEEETFEGDWNVGNPSFMITR